MQFIQLFTFLFSRITNESFEYFHHLESASHRKAWTSVLVLILTKLLQLDDDRVSLTSSRIIIE